MKKKPLGHVHFLIVEIFFFATCKYAFGKKKINTAFRIKVVLKRLC